MKKGIITSCVAFTVAMLILFSCSEDDNQGPGQGPNEVPLKAEAGPDQTVAPFTIVTLDGSASTGPTGAFNYQWIINSNAGQINLASDPGSTNGAKVTFEPKVNGTYSFTLRITNGSSFSEDLVNVIVTGALSLGGTLTQTTTLVDVDPDSSMPDYILDSDLIIPDGVQLNFGLSSSGESITIKVTNNSGIIVQTGGRLNVVNGSNHKLTADTGWKGILVDGGAIDLYALLAIDKAGASLFSGQTEPAAITFAGNSPQIVRMRAVNFTNSPSLDILAVTEVSGTNDIIAENTFSNMVPIKAPMAFVNKLGFNNMGTYDYIHLVPSGAGTIDALVGGQYSFDSNYKYFIDGDFTSGSPITMTSVTILMKEGAGLLAQQSLNINGSTIKGVDGTNWKGIAFAGASQQLVISNTIIENAGSDIFSTGFFTSSFKAAIYFSSGNDSNISNVTITNSGGYGVYNDSPSSNVTMQNSTFTGTTLSALSVRVDRVHTGVSGTGNTFTMPAGVAAVEVRVPNSTVSPVSSWQALGGDNYYLFSGSAYLSSGSWGLQPGVNLRFKAGKTLYLQSGNFTAIGTALAPITFGSEAGTAGTWAGIHVQTTTRFEFCEIRNGGEALILKNGVTPATEKANVVFDYGGGITTNTFKNNTVAGSGGYGILVETGRQNPDVLNVANNNTFSSNTSGSAIVK